MSLAYHFPTAQSKLKIIRIFSSSFFHSKEKKQAHANEIIFIHIYNNKYFISIHEIMKNKKFEEAS
jgi:hypothetical protein